MIESPWIKLCGLGRPDDVALGVSGGANMLGFVHYEPSPRSVAIDAVGALTAGVPPDVTTVLVVVDAGPGQLASWSERAGVSAVQLCGAERPGDYADFPLPILRRIGVGPGARNEIDAWHSVARAFVLDHPAAPGGTGLGVDLEQARSLSGIAPCLLAGGLDADNLRERVLRVRPAGVDASSRLESSPGIKDPVATAAYLAAAQQALHKST